MLEVYTQYRGDIQTGDAIFFSGKGAKSDLIKFFSKGEWSHIGMAYRPVEHLLLLWESTTLSNIKDMDTDSFVKGVQLVPLSQRITNYNGRVGWRKLLKDDGYNPILTEYQLESLNKFRRAVAGRPYEEKHMELLRAALDLWGDDFTGNEEDLSSIFCSELFAEALQQMNVIYDRIPSNEYVPMDWVAGKQIEQQLQEGYEYDDMVLLKDD